MCVGPMCRLGDLWFSAHCLTAGGLALRTWLCRVYATRENLHYIWMFDDGCLAYASYVYDSATPPMIPLTPAFCVVICIGVIGRRSPRPQRVGPVLGPISKVSLCSALGLCTADISRNDLVATSLHTPPPERRLCRYVCPPMVGTRCVQVLIGLSELFCWHGVALVRNCRCCSLVMQYSIGCVSNCDLVFATPLPLSLVRKVSSRLVFGRMAFRPHRGALVTLASSVGRIPGPLTPKFDLGG